jgi:hypothetical protein
MTFAPKNISRDKSTHMFNGSSRFAPSYVFQPPKNRVRASLSNSTPEQGRQAQKKEEAGAPSIF